LFRITLRGDRALRTWLARRPAWPPPLRDEIIVRMLAAERHGPTALLAQLELQEAEYRRYLTLVQSEAVHDAPVTRRLAHEAAVGLAEAHLRWLARCREIIPARDASRAGGEREGVAAGGTREQHLAAGEAGARDEVRATKRDVGDDSPEEVPSQPEQ
jgi:hypothetical protein